MIATSFFGKTFFSKKKIIKVTATCFLISIMSVSFAAKPEDMVMILKVNPQGKTDIYNLTKGLGAIKDNTQRNYHATVGWIPNGKKDKYNAELQEWMKNALKAEPAVTYVSGGADILRASPECPDPDNTPNSKKCTRYAIVLAPDEKTKSVLKGINQRLNEELQEFNQKYGTSYVMYPDIIPPYFTPHITFADTGQVNKNNRASVINDINARIESSKFKMVKLQKY